MPKQQIDSILAALNGINADYDVWLTDKIVSPGMQVDRPRGVFDRVSQFYRDWFMAPPGCLISHSSEMTSVIAAMYQFNPKKTPRFIALSPRGPREAANRRWAEACGLCAGKLEFGPDAPAIVEQLRHQPGSLPQDFSGQLGRQSIAAALGLI
ncbi:hypothetical protein M1523_00075 [Patescibacteria group bacterium]|nr:hypothetical protein [Patescibacteria group bacterium]MCL5091786.1 hypothetical protein [Patescibacteria group bacterium]